jgi:hypothetical protein
MRAGFTKQPHITLTTASKIYKEGQLHPLNNISTQRTPTPKQKCAS